jgi:poly-gamma-glutamate synthesis protein (capsule biosynthesis protein)
MTAQDTPAGDADHIHPHPWPEVDAEACIHLVGDVNLQQRDQPEHAFRHVVKTLSEADLRFCNLEGCLYRPGENDIPEKEWWEHSDESMVRGLVAAEFGCVGQANNVTYGAKAVRNTFNVLDREGIDHCGAGESLAEAQAPAVVSIHGTTVGFLQRTARYYGETAVATENSPGVAVIDPDEPSYVDEPVASVKALRSAVDVLVFSHHLRRASTTEIEPYQRELSQAVIDSGADVVLGHGAHVNQGIEIYRGRPIFHSVGQFAFDGEKIRDRTDGLLVRVHVTNGDIKRVGFVPVSRDADNDVYLAGPNTPNGHRQLDQLKELFPNSPFEVGDFEAVLEGIGTED